MTCELSAWGGGGGEVGVLVTIKVQFFHEIKV